MKIITSICVYNNCTAASIGTFRPCSCVITGVVVCIQNLHIDDWFLGRRSWIWRWSGSDPEVILNLEVIGKRSGGYPESGGDREAIRRRSWIWRWSGSDPEAILNLKGQIDSLLPEGPVIMCFIIPLCCKDTQKNDYFNRKLIRSIIVLISLVWMTISCF